MKKTNKRILLAIVCVILSVCIIGAISVFAAEETTTPESKGEIQVWLIAGQSNAVGYGLEVPEDGRTDSRFTEGFENVIAYGRLGGKMQSDFAPVKVGMGKNDTACGAEVGIASALGNSGEMHAVIKYAVGATKLHPCNASTWTSPSYVDAVQNDEDTTNDINSAWTKIGDYYDTFMQTVTDGLALLVADGYTPVIKGLWWMQGEAETTIENDWAPEYEKLLTYLVDDMRNDLAEIANDASLNGEDPMPFVIGKINRNPDVTEEEQAKRVDIVNAAQVAVSEKRENVSVVDAKNSYKYHQYDSWHYNTETQMYLGEQFVAEVLIKENKHLVYADGRYAGINTGMYTAGESVTVNFNTVEDYSITELNMQIGNGEPVAIELTDGTYTIDSMPAANVKFAITASGADVVTDYGTIPGEYCDPMDYPFAIFKGGEFVAVDNTFTTGAVAKAANAGDGAIILVRSDYNMSGDGNGKSYLSMLNGTMTIDLGGNTVTMGGKSGNFDGMIKCEAHVLGNVTNVTMKNGNIILGEDPVVRFSGANAADRTSPDYVAGYKTNPQKFTVTLESIDFSLDPTYSGYENTLLYTYENISGDHPEISDGTLIVKDCNFDFSGIENACRLFGTGNIKVKCQLLGGSIKLDDTQDISWSYGAKTVLNVGTGTDGEYTKLILPVGAEYPKNSFKNIDSNTCGFDFVKAEGETIEYQIAEGTPTKYGFIPTTYASASTYPWVVFDNNGKCLVGTKLWANVSDLANSATAVASTAGVDTVILLRANYALNSKQGSVANNNVQATLSRHDGTVTIDLNGFTVTANNNNTDAFIKGEANKLGATTTVILKNGKYIVGTKALVRFSAVGSETRTNAAYLAGCAENPQTFNVILENLDISLSGGTTPLDKGMLLYTSISSAAGVKANSNLTVKDCNIDYGDFAAPTPLFGASKDLPVDVTVIGSTLKANDLSAFKYTSSSYITLRVSQNDYGKYIQLIVPKDTSVTTAIPKDLNYSSTVTDLGYYKIGVDGDYDVYELQSPVLVTPYGNINAQYYSTSKYPWVVFDKDGKCVMGTKLFTTEAAAAACTAGDGSVIYLRRDTNFDTDKQSGGTQSITKINGTINIDLGGYTVTMGKGGSADAFIRCEAYGSGYTTNIIMTNGKIVAGLDPIVRFSAINTRWPDGYDTNTDPEKVHNFYVTLEGLDISIDADSAKQSASVIMFGAPTSGYTIKLTNNNVYVKNCNIDLTNSVATTAIFGSPATIKANGYLIGGSVTFGDVIPKVSSIYGQTFYTVADDNGNYTVFKYLKGSTAHDDEFKTDGEGMVSLGKIGEEGDYDVYRLRPVEVAGVDYSPKMSITLDSQLVLNVYIPANSTQKFTFNGETYEDITTIADKKVTIGDKEYYHFEVALGSAEAAKDLVLEATVDIGEQLAKATFTMSIPKYAAKVLNNSSATDIEKTLVKDVLAYVKAAYNYFTEFNSAEEIARVNELINTILAIGGEYVGETTLTGEAVTVTPVTDVTLNLDAKPAIRFYVTDTNVEFYADGKKLDTVTGTDETYGAYVELDVYAYVLAETITYGEGGTYHIADFLTKSLGTNHENLVACFVKYIESAADYRESVMGMNN